MYRECFKRENASRTTCFKLYIILGLLKIVLCPILYETVDPSLLSLFLLQPHPFWGSSEGEDLISENAEDSYFLDFLRRSCYVMFSWEIPDLVVWCDCIYKDWKRFLKHWADFFPISSQQCFDFILSRKEIYQRHQQSTTVVSWKRAGIFIFCYC